MTKSSTPSFRINIFNKYIYTIVLQVPEGGNAKSAGTPKIKSVGRNRQIWERLLSVFFLFPMKVVKFFIYGI